MMKRKWSGVSVVLAGLAVLALTFSACTPPAATFPTASLALFYADLKQLYGQTRVGLVAACLGPSAKLDQATCDRLKEADAQLMVADALIREAIKNPQQQVDFEKVSAFVQAAIKLGAASQTGGLSGLFLK
jgi:hypothetical protein